jgi:hypothetical protein
MYKHISRYCITNPTGIFDITGIFDGRSTDAVVTCIHIEIISGNATLLGCDWIADHYLIDSWECPERDAKGYVTTATLDLRTPPLWMADHIRNKGGLSVFGTHQIRYRFASVGEVANPVFIQVTCCIDGDNP